MKIGNTLTKENFWNDTMVSYPKATKLFCDWIDEYKKAVGWGNLFNKHYNTGNDNGWNLLPKFHDIPYAMQQGIWIAFVEDTISKFFEQPEYSYSFDLEDDIKTVFFELESEIDNA